MTLTAGMLVHEDALLQRSEHPTRCRRCDVQTFNVVIRDGSKTVPYSAERVAFQTYAIHDCRPQPKEAA